MMLHCSIHPPTVTGGMHDLMTEWDLEVGLYANHDVVKGRAPIPLRMRHAAR